MLCIPLLHGGVALQVLLLGVRCGRGVVLT
jgi:hypothetical protein